MLKLPSFRKFSAALMAALFFSLPLSATNKAICGVTVLPNGDTVKDCLQATWNPPTASLSVSPAAVPRGQSVTVSWSSTAANACTLTYPSQSVNGTSNSGLAVVINVDTTFSLTCQGPGGSITEQRTATVIPPPTVTLSVNGSHAPGTVAFHSTLSIAWVSANATACDLSPTGTHTDGRSFSGTLLAESSVTFTVTCVGNGGTASDTVAVQVTPPPVTVLLTVNGSHSPPAVARNSTVTISFVVAHATACVLSPLNVQTAGTNFQGTAIAGNPVTLTVSCSGPGGNASDSVAVSLLPDPLAPTVVLTINGSGTPAAVAAGSTLQVAWTTTNATLCEAPTLGVTTQGTNYTGTAPAPPAPSRTYTVTCSGAGGQAQSSVTVAVAAAPGAPTVALLINGSHEPDAVAPNAMITVTWQSTNSTSCSLPLLGLSNSGGNFSGTATATRSQLLRVVCTGPSGTAADEVQLDLDCLPVTKSFLSFEEFPEGHYISNTDNDTFKTTAGFSFDYHPQPDHPGARLRVARISEEPVKNPNRQGPRWLEDALPFFNAWKSGVCQQQPAKNRLCNDTNPNRAGRRALSTSEALDTKNISFDINYVVPVQELSFLLFDFDGSETYTITAHAASGRQIAGSNLDTQGYGQNSDNSASRLHSVRSRAPNIKQVRIRGEKNSREFGLGFDNFRTGVRACP